MKKGIMSGKLNGKGEQKVENKSENKEIKLLNGKNSVNFKKGGVK